jgi:hypothetical protein
LIENPRVVEFHVNGVKIDDGSAEELVASSHLTSTRSCSGGAGLVLAVV